MMDNIFHRGTAPALPRKWHCNVSLLLIFTIGFLLTQAAQADEKIRYARQETLFDQRDEYPVKMLKLALQKAGSEVTLEPAATFMPQGRVLQELEHGRYFDIAWSMTSAVREERLLPVRICIYKGLMGWRIPFVTKENENLLSKVKVLADLKKMTAGQGQDWPDTTILRQAGFKVEVGDHYESLFKMLKARRFDYFPRGLIEIWRELDAGADKDLIVDQHLLLRYQVGFYFFVNRNNPELAKTIQRGLEKAIKDGSFNELFNQYFGDSIRRSQLDKRTVIDIENALLPLDTPINRKELWYKLENDRDLNKQSLSK